MVGLLGYPVVQGQARVVSLAIVRIVFDAQQSPGLDRFLDSELHRYQHGRESVRSYAVWIFYFPRAGRHEFATGVQHPPTPIPTGQSHEGGLPISNQVSLASDTTFIMAIRTVTFDDGTSWTNDDLNSQI